MATQNQFTTMSAAAQIAPVVLWADQNNDEGNLYLEVNHTFLDFYTDEKKAIKRSACARSASADGRVTTSFNSSSDFEGDEKKVMNRVMPRKFSNASVSQMSTTTTCSPRGSFQSFLSSGSMTSDDLDVHMDNALTNLQGQSSWADFADLQSPDATPRHSYFQQESSGACEDKVISGADLTGMQNPDATPDVTPRFSWADLTDCQSPDATPRNMCHWQESSVAYDNKKISGEDVQTPKMPVRSKKNRHPAAAINWDADTDAVTPPPAHPKAMPVVMLPIPTVMQRQVNEEQKQMMMPFQEQTATQVKPDKELPTLTVNLNLLLNSAGGAQVTKQPSSTCNSKTAEQWGNSQTQVKPRNTQSENASQVKRSKNKKLNKSVPASADDGTTLMIRGIPCGLTQEAVLALLDDAGLKGTYNFFYLPVDPVKNANLGYAFVNFVKQQFADHCTTVFSGVQLAPWRSAKRCSVSLATMQGLPQLTEHFRKASVTNGSRGPLFLA